MNAPMKSLVYFGAVLLTLNPCFADAQRGAYLAKIMDCGGCHTPGQMKGQPDHSRALAGGDVGFKLPGLGIFYPPNLTGQGDRVGKMVGGPNSSGNNQGVRPDGRQLAPIMPYHSYSRPDRC